jgi:hypothetical protein
MKCFFADGFRRERAPISIRANPNPAGISQVPGAKAVPKLAKTSATPPTLMKTVNSDSPQSTSPKQIVITGMGFLKRMGFGREIRFGCVVSFGFIRGNGI